MFLKFIDAKICFLGHSYKKDEKVKVKMQLKLIL